MEAQGGFRPRDRDILLPRMRLDSFLDARDAAQPFGGGLWVFRHSPARSGSGHMDGTGAFVGPFPGGFAKV